MTTSISEDWELVDKEPIPFYGYYYLVDPFANNDQTLLNLVLRIIKVEYRLDDSNEEFAN